MSKKKGLRRQMTATGDPALRYEDTEIEQRRTQVFEFYFVRGLDPGVIAELLGVHRNTIGTDLRAIREKMAQNVREGDVVEAVGLQAALYDRIAQTAMVEFERTEGARVKNAFLSTALGAIERKTRMLIDIGFLPSRRNELDLRFSGSDEADSEISKAKFPDIMQDPASRRRCLQFLEKIVGISTTTEIVAKAAIRHVEDAELKNIDATVIESQEP